MKLVNVYDMMQVKELSAALAKSIKHVSFHPSGNLISTVDTNGAIRIYSLSTEEPAIIETLSSIVPIVHSPESPLSCKVAWHPDGGSFAAPSATRDVVIYDRIEWKRQVVFRAEKGHLGPITDIAWSPNGAYLASCAQDKTIIIWLTATQKIVRKIDLALYALQVVWHPNKNTISWTTDEGELYTLNDLVDDGQESSFARPVRPSPLLESGSSTKIRGQTNGKSNGSAKTTEPTRDPDIDDEALLDDLEDAGAEWIEDDDGAGYIPNLENRNKRSGISNGYGSDGADRPSKRSKVQGLFQSQAHDIVQPGSTPWRGQRRYLTLNMIGWIWTVEQDDRNTVTVEFHDREAHRQYHFSDSAHFTFAALDDLGALFASSIRTQDGVRMPSVVHYRPHDSWASHSNWSISLPEGEDIKAIALSNSGIVVCTSCGYIRMYSLHGVPKRIYQSKSSPIVSAISHGNYVMVVANGAIRADGAAELVYSIYHTYREEVIQSNDVLSLQSETTLRSLFYGEDGNPYIYSSRGILCVLSKWKTPGQAQWVPVLDTNLLQRRVGKDENYWPVAVSENKFHCIILKGAERHPYFPRPITSEFDFLIPITTPDHVEKSQASFEIQMVQDSVLSTLAEDAEDENEARRLDENIDRNLLQLLNLACKNEQDARALDLCELLRNTRSLDGAVKIAGHHNRINLAERIGRISTGAIDI